MSPAAVLARAYDWRFAAAAVVTVVVYGALTFAISDWRIGHRRVLNEADSEASGRAVDALLNYETVKTFGAEARAAAAYDAALGTYAEASEKANASLALLNMMQGLVQKRRAGGHGRARGAGGRLRPHGGGRG